MSPSVCIELPFENIPLPRCQELVTLSSQPLLKSPQISNAGTHLSAVEFHSALQSAGKFLVLAHGILHNWL